MTVCITQFAHSHDIFVSFLHFHCHLGKRKCSLNCHFSLNTNKIWAQFGMQRQIFKAAQWSTTCFLSGSPHWRGKRCHVWAIFFVCCVFTLHGRHGAKIDDSKAAWVTLGRSACCCHSSMPLALMVPLLIWSRTTWSGDPSCNKREPLTSERSVYCLFRFPINLFCKRWKSFLKDCRHGLIFTASHHCCKKLVSLLSSVKLWSTLTILFIWVGPTFALRGALE